MRRFRWIMLLSLLVILAACGGGGDDESDNSTSSDDGGGEADAVQPSPTPEPAAGLSLRTTLGKGAVMW